MSADTLSSSPKLVVINTSNTRYHAVRTAASALGWVVEDEGREDAPRSFHGDPILPRSLGSLLPNEVRKKYSSATTPQLMWVDKSVLSKRVADLAPHQRLNHFAGMNCIGRKAQLFRRLMKIKKKTVTGGGGLKKSLVGDEEGADLHAVLSDIAPVSFSSSSEANALELYLASDEAAAGQRQFYIVKPNKGCEGRGIRITRHPLDVLTSEEMTAAGECLIQAYVDRPLLIEGKKFDLRLYVLLTAISPQKGHPLGLLGGMHLFVHRRGLVRMCASSYETPTDGNAASPSMHLTNYAVNKKSSDYRICDQNDEDESMQDGNKRDLKFLAEFVDKHTAHGWAAVQRRIHECIVLTILSGAGVLRRELEGAGATRGHRADGRNCFELLGFDVMLQERDAVPVLMEVNHSPSLFCDSDFDYSVKREVLMDTFKLLDVYIPGMEDCVDGKSYAAFAQREIISTRDAVGGDKEAQLVAGNHVGYNQLLPDYCMAGDAVQADNNWTAQERGRQMAMLTLGNSVL